MGRDGMVQWWARWSRNTMARYAEDKGPRGVAAHDVAQKVIEKGFRFYEVEPDASALAGMLLAMSLVQHNETLPQDIRTEAAAFLQLQAGLAAEVIESLGHKRVFEDLVGAGNESGSASVAVPEVRHSEGGEDMTGIFSCNAAGDVWRTTGKGWTPPHERVNLRGTDPRLDGIVLQVLLNSPSGGRFRISPDGVYLVRDLQKVA